jgi:hypothetical protein
MILAQLLGYPVGFRGWFATSLAEKVMCKLWLDDIMRPFVLRTSFAVYLFVLYACFQV